MLLLQSRVTFSHFNLASSRYRNLNETGIRERIVLPLPLPLAPLFSFHNKSLISEAFLPFQEDSRRDAAAYKYRSWILIRKEPFRSYIFSTKGITSNTSLCYPFPTPLSLSIQPYWGETFSLFTRRRRQKTLSHEHDALFSHRIAAGYSCEIYVAWRPAYLSTCELGHRRVNLREEKPEGKDTYLLEKRAMNVESSEKENVSIFSLYSHNILTNISKD